MHAGHHRASERALRIAEDRLAVIDERIAAQTAARDRLAAALRSAADRPHSP
ncbi:hypothetical protein [Kitasatospora sp. NPDC050543]|uniref:hypothetical protein n=1 Tax=Kitasatospora sp. NPDC050543 TaxID=3364054 RepID=UPI00379F4232